MPGDIAGVGGQRVFQRAGHGAERRLVQNVVNALAGLAAVADFADVAFNEGKARPLRRGH